MVTKLSHLTYSFFNFRFSLLPCTISATSSSILSPIHPSILCLSVSLCMRLSFSPSFSQLFWFSLLHYSFPLFSTSTPSTKSTNPSSYYLPPHTSTLLYLSPSSSLRYATTTPLHQPPPPSPVSCSLDCRMSCQPATEAGREEVIRGI